jgi:hypothetical protein
MANGFTAGISIKPFNSSSTSLTPVALAITSADFPLQQYFSKYACIFC